MSQPELLNVFSISPTFSLSFLGAKDVVALDSACAGGVIRKLFLSSLTRASLPQLVCASYNMKWFLRRKVLPVTIELGMLLTENDLIMLSEITSSVRELHVIEVQSRVWRPLPSWNIQSLVRFCPQLQRIVKHTDTELLGIRFPIKRSSSDDHLLFAQSCPLLTEISIRIPDFKLADFETILRRCKQLSIIDIRDCVEMIRAGALDSIAALCPKMAALTLNGTDTLNEDTLQRIATSCSQLTCLRISERPRYDDMFELLPVFPTGFSGIAQNCASLQQIVLDGVHIAYADFLCLIRSSFQLRDVRLSRFECVDAPAHWFNQIVQCLPDLETFKLQRNTSLTDTDVLALAQHCPKLRTFAIKNCMSIISDRAHEAIVTHCPALECLELDIYSYTSAAVMDKIANNCARLQKLMIGFTNDAERALSELFLHCRHLTHLRCSCNGNLDLRNIAPLMCNLQCLEVHNYGHQRDSCILAVVTHCPKLQSLTVRRRKKFTDTRIVRTIEQNCPRLNKCNLLSYCSSAMVKALTALQARRALRGVHFEFLAVAVDCCC